MTVPTRERIQEVRDGLQAATEATHDVIRRAEAVFARDGLIVEVYVPLEEQVERGRPRPAMTHLLGWRPVDGAWRLVVESRPRSGHGPSTVCPLTTSSRHYRLEALRALPLFHGLLVAASSACAPTTGSSP